MSRVRGAVINNGLVLGYFEYDGGADIAISAIWPTYKELHENWRSGIWNKCNCGEPPQAVILYADYGGGFHWPAKICLRCKAIVENVAPSDTEGIECTDGLPPGAPKPLFE